MIFGVFFLTLCLLFPDILINRNQAEILVAPMVEGCGIALLFASFLNNRKVNLAFIVLSVGILSLTYLARRSGIFSFTVLLLAAYLLNLKSLNRPMIFKIFPSLIGVVIIVSMNNSKLNSTIGSKLQDRLTEDTRSAVFEFYFLSMADDWIFGKGMNGVYYCPIGGEIEEENVEFTEVNYREAIENGYLQLILSGGILHLMLFLLILAPAAFLGIFKSSNQFTRACGLIILLWLIDMFLYGLPTLSLHYIFVWISVGYCINSELRKRSDEDIRSEFLKFA
jgi:O-antigen ligase